MIALMVEAALRSLVLGGVVWLAMHVFRPRNPHLQKTIWITVLVASLAMPFVLKTRLAPAFDVPTSLATLAQPVNVTAHAAPVSAFQWALGAATAIYVLVVTTLLARFAFGLSSIWRIRRSATSLTHAEGLDVRVSPKIASPATFGSTILLPSSSVDWDEATLEAILSHERSHVKYGDCYVQWLARVHACVFWFNPLAWWLNRKLADLAETTSDDAVLELMLDRTAYANLLLEIARHPAPTTVTSAARSNIAARIERIISNIPPASPPRRWVRGAAVVALMPLFVLAAATAQSPAPLANPNLAGTDKDPNEPHIIATGAANYDSLYPARAKRWGVEGWAMVNATLDEEGQVTDVQVIEISPADTSYGFEAAATQVAMGVRFDNPTRQPRQVKFRVKFDLTDKHGGAAPNLDSPRPAGG
jgi:TonB family protein